MSKHPVAESWPTLQRVDAERVLRRAIEIEERRGEWIDGPELRRIAVETGVDPRSVALALAEVPIPAAPAPKPYVPPPPPASAKPVARPAAVTPSPAATPPPAAPGHPALDGLLCVSLVSAFIGLVLGLGKLVLWLAGAAATATMAGAYWLLLAGVLGAIAFMVIDEHRR